MAEPHQDVEAAPRVALAQAQARPTLGLAVAFAVAAAVAAAAPHDTGAWLPLHLFLVGSVLLAISAASQLLAVTWSAGRPGNELVVAVQRGLVAVGAAGIAVARERDLATGAVVVFGLCVTAGLAVLAGLLLFEVWRSRVRRFDPAVHFYLAALVAGVAGTAVGAAMVDGHPALRDTHVILNLLGLVGLVIAGTLPFFSATQARMKMASHATPARLRVALGWLAGSVAVAATAAAAERPGVVGVGLLAYAAGLLHLCTALPRPREKQLAWAGPRLVQLGCGVLWWAGTVAVAALRALDGNDPFPEPLVITLVVGGFAQIVVSSLAYFGPVLRGGGHVRLSAGFATTRSWVALVAGNVAAVACAIEQRDVAVVAVLVLALDVATRAALLVQGARRTLTRPVN